MAAKLADVEIVDLPVGHAYPPLHPEQLAEILLSYASPGQRPAPSDGPAEPDTREAAGGEAEAGSDSACPPSLG
jgi:hypothetical protein